MILSFPCNKLVEQDVVGGLVRLLNPLFGFGLVSAEENEAAVGDVDDHRHHHQPKPKILGSDTKKFQLTFYKRRNKSST